MGKFVCDRCGKCCRSFGAYITIERQLSSRDYYCRFGITSELFLAHVEPEYADAIADKYEEGESGDDTRRKQCFFLQKERHGNGFTCAIYLSRPLICREFQCYRMVIYNHDRQQCGLVIGRAELKTADEDLTKLWAEKIVHIPAQSAPCPPRLQHRHQRKDTESRIHGSHVNDSSWADTVVAILREHGYDGYIVE